jgi:hypothetical protein
MRDLLGVRPRRLDGAGARPLNFTVRCRGDGVVWWVGAAVNLVALGYD